MAGTSAVEFVFERVDDSGSRVIRLISIQAPANRSPDLCYWPLVVVAAALLAIVLIEGSGPTAQPSAT